MTRVILKPRYDLKAPIDAGVVSPDAFKGLSLRRIRGLEVWEGNAKKKLLDLFVTKVGPSKSKELTIVLRGDVRRVRRIGKAMSFGRIVVEGDVGMYLGENMKGGEITVRGDAGSWLGMGMSDGTIKVRGNVGDYIGSAYRGTTRGMKGGTIVVHGNAGNEIGSFMRGGIIRVRGKAGQFPGSRMKKGTILIQGDCGGRMGASMKGGKIIVCRKVPDVLPSFSIEAIKENVKAGDKSVTGPFYMFMGDISESGSGRLYVSVAKNAQLRSYKRLLK